MDFVSYGKWEQLAFFAQPVDVHSLRQIDAGEGLTGSYHSVEGVTLILVLGNCVEATKVLTDQLLLSGANG